MSDDDPVYAPAIRRLWSLLDDLDERGFSLNPLDLMDNVAAAWRLLTDATAVLTRRPPGDPAELAAAASAWGALQQALRAAADDVDAERVRRRAHWTGAAASAFERTAHRLQAALDDASSGARRASVALDDHATALAAARRRHDDVGALLVKAGHDLSLPFHLDDFVRHLRDAVTAAIESWQQAQVAAGECAAVLRATSAAMPFPEALAPGVRALDSTGLHGPGSGFRPLTPGVLGRAEAAYGRLDAADRAAFDGLVDTAASDQHRAWLLAALASGHPVAVVARFASAISAYPVASARDEPTIGDVLDPVRLLAAEDGTLRQSSGTTCGSSSLVVASLLRDPLRALWLTTGYDAVDDTLDSREPVDRFRELEMAMKARTDDPRVDPDGGLSPDSLSAWWPAGLGTSPWAAAEELGAIAPPGTAYQVHLVDSTSSDDRAEAFAQLVAATDAGDAAALYVGDRTSPRHVVLVYGHGDGTLDVYEPGAGETRTVTREAFVSGDLQLGGWPVPWAVIAP